MGNIRGASANWRPLKTAGRVDLLAGQRSQLQQCAGEPVRPANLESTRLNESFGSNHSSETYGSRETYGTARSSNAMEINKIAQCSKMVPGMSGSEIRSALTAVNWDTVLLTFDVLIFSILFYSNQYLGLYRILIWPDIRPPDIRPIILPDTGYPAGYPAK